MNQAVEKGMSFIEFSTQFERKFKEEEGLLDVFNKIIDASKQISIDVNRAGLGNIIGKANKENIQGEEVMKLDEISNELLINELKKSPYCAGVASEELDEETPFHDTNTDKSKYLVLFDPLDGSGNIDNNAPIGTIFNIFKRKSTGKVVLSDYLQKGSDTICAGYVLYGSSTMLVYTLGEKVHGFTFDIHKDQFELSHFDIKTPTSANQFSVNYGNISTFKSHVQQFANWCCDEDSNTKRPYSLRYIGAMVADVHRILIKGGIFIYPATVKTPNGKLRLLFECIPLSFVMHVAGGLSTDDAHSILDIVPSSIHQRCPIALGSKDLIHQYLSYI